MSIKNRPYTGTWEMGRQTVVRYTPDAKVLINGHTELAVCATCGDSTDFNKYITTISCDVSTDPISTASLTLVVPRHEAEVFSHDGNYVLHPGLEVVILMRGYFPVTGYAMKGQEGASKETAATDSADDTVPVYPYYQVFRGVVTEATHEYSGGFYTASVTCSSILHFWQYLYIKTNGSVFGTAPEGEGGGIDLRGHKFSSMSPYAIIYTLMRVGFGAAFGQGWTISQAHNLAAVDETSGKSLYKHAALWWEKRWQESSMRLRMYGMDGSLFNALEQSYLGMFDKSETKVSEFVKDLEGVEKGTYDMINAPAARQATARRIGYRGTESTAAIMDEKGTKLDALKMQAYTLDLGRLGQLNMFEAEYMSKLEIANAVKEVCGYEFYQDVDGDIVFKPPFYNLDTSEDEVYCIRDRDLLSCSESEREPEATYVKGSGSLFQNFQGVLSGEFGTREGKFADWRLIAKFGWRESNFESHYYSGAKQMFIGAILRLDVVNAEMRTAQITIPMRPEMRPGYPVWVEHLDCFFYAKSLSHSFAAGSSAQTTITGIAKRAKWLPPGFPDRSEGPGSQPLPTLDDMRLDAPGDYPPMPLYVFPEDIEGAEAGASGPPRVMGLPNVVMALDPTKINPAVLPGGSLYFTNGQTYFDTALTLGALRRDPDNPEQYRLAVDGDSAHDLKVSQTAVVTAFDNYATAIQMPEGTKDEQAAKEAALMALKSNTFGALIVAVEAQLGSAVPDAGQLNAYMGLQRNLKNVFGAGKAAGEYRYFSSSAPNVEDQSPSSVTVDAEQQKVLTEIPGGPVDSNLTGLTMLYKKGDRIGVKGGMPRRGFRVYGFNPPGEEEKGDTAIGHVDTSTREIRFVTFQKITNRVPVTNATIGSNGRAALLMAPESMAALFREILVATADTGKIGDSAEDRFGGDTTQDKKGYGMLWDAIQNLASDLGVTGRSDWSTLDGVTIGSPVGENLAVFANSFEAFTKSVQTAAAGTEKQVFYVYPALYEGVGGGAVYHPRNGTVAVVHSMQGSQAYDKQGVPLDKRTKNVATDPTYRRVPIPKDTSLQVSRENRSNIGLTNKTDPQGVAAVATRSGEALSLNFQFVQQVWYQYWPDETSDPTEDEETAFATFIEKITKDHDFEVNNTNGRTEVLVGDYVEKGMYTTVLPVSDNRGYEVYGTMAYGRGLTIKSYKSLLEINGSPTDTASMLAVERFLALLIATPYDDAWVSNALGTLGGEGKAQLAAIMEVEEVNLEAAIKELKSSSDSAAVFVRNTPVTTSSRGQSFTMAVSAEELASLTTSDTTICLCKGTENSYWIQAFTGEFVELHGDEAVNEFLVAEAKAAGEDYTITKQALSGEMMDLSSGNKWAETIQGAKNSVASLGNTLTSAGQAIDEEFREATAAVRRNIDNVGDLIDQAREADSLAEFNENVEIRGESQGTREQEQERDDEAKERLTQTTGVPLDFFTLVGPTEDQGDDT